ncbi:MAG: hypothetical protein RML72_10105 [Bacteroidia bacterium]|nr:hypothetical protein [Bacteroidia bacterium]MDW8159210.1 hypothetical protein [Bacteroidia bacterium]
MKNYLGIIFRNQFALFYKYGYIFIPKPHLIQFNKNITPKIKRSLIKIFKKLTPFEYEEEYLILHLTKNEQEGKNLKNSLIRFLLQDVVAIYPLSQRAKTVIESRINPKIRIESPIFEEILPKIEYHIETTQMEHGIEALWHSCQVEGKASTYIDNIGWENILKGMEHRKKGNKATDIQRGSYWEYLITYERYSYFPNTTLGYFYDAGQVFSYSKGLPGFEGSSLHAFLEEINNHEPGIKFTEVVKRIESDDRTVSYINQTSTGATKNYIIAPLFLMLRDDIRKCNDINQAKLFKNLGYLKTFEDSFKHTVVLLGAFFGFSKFYDLYYDKLNLRFYKECQQPKFVNTQPPEAKKKNEPLPPSSINPDLFGNNYPDIHQQYEELTAPDPTDEPSIH